MLLISTSNAWISEQSKFVVVYSIWPLCTYVLESLSLECIFEFRTKFSFFFRCKMFGYSMLTHSKDELANIISVSIPFNRTLIITCSQRLVPLEFYFVNVFNRKFNFSWMFEVQKYAHIKILQLFLAPYSATGAHIFFCWPTKSIFLGDSPALIHSPQSMA